MGYNKKAKGLLTKIFAPISLPKIYKLKMITQQAMRKLGAINNVVDNNRLFAYVTKQQTKQAI